jgi:hypothetical protein
MNQNIEARLRKLEEAIKAKGCDTCRDWPMFEDTIFDYALVGGPPAPERHYPAVCPDCGKQGPGVVRLTVVPARVPQ